MRRYEDERYDDRRYDDRRYDDRRYDNDRERDRDRDRERDRDDRGRPREGWGTGSGSEWGHGDPSSTYASGGASGHGEHGGRSDRGSEDREGGGGDRRGLAPGRLSEEEILGIIEARHNAKMTRNFEEADRIRDELRNAGVSVDDKARTWTASDGRSGVIPSGGGFARGDRQLDDGSIQWANTIYVSNLPSDVAVEDIAEFFSQIGPIKKSKKSHNFGEPTIHIYKDKRTNRPKGDATISFEDSGTAQSAIKWFDGAPFQNRPGSKLSVSIATRPSAGGWGGGKGGGKGGGGGWR